jgi:hypothetical protein
MANDSMLFVWERAVAYYRVSTRRQQRSGLGIDAQRAAVARFAKAEGITIAREHVEAKTGQRSDALERRPELATALVYARKLKCSVVVAKLDRRSRDVAFISGFMAQRVPFIGAAASKNTIDGDNAIVCEMPWRSYGEPSCLSAGSITWIDQGQSSAAPDLAPIDAANVRH